MVTGNHRHGITTGVGVQQFACLEDFVASIAEIVVFARPAPPSVPDDRLSGATVTSDADVGAEFAGLRRGFKFGLLRSFLLLLGAGDRKFADDFRPLLFVLGVFCGVRHIAKRVYVTNNGGLDVTSLPNGKEWD